MGCCAGWPDRPRQGRGYMLRQPDQVAEQGDIRLPVSADGMVA